MFGQELLMVGWAPGGHICSANAIFLNNRAIRDPMGCGTKRPAMYQCVTHLVLLPINSGLKVATFLFMCTEDRGEPICGERKCAEIESRQPPGSCSLGSETSLILIM